MNEIQRTEKVRLELERRADANVEVSLLWSRADNRVSVCVVDSKAGYTFELPVEDESPLDVFHHPYAYAAFRGTAYYQLGGVEVES
jgi:hypothetical protein